MTNKSSEKRCSRCSTMRHREDFHKNRRNKDGLDYMCKVCARKRYYSHYRSQNGLIEEVHTIKKYFMYGPGDVLRNKKYLKDRAELFKENGPGWWWNPHKYRTAVRRRRIENLKK